MEMSEQVADLAAALSKAQAEIAGAKKDSTNPHFNSSYADLASVWDACREPLTKNGIAVVQGASADGASISMTTCLLHASGQWMRSTLTTVARDASPQSIGSACTYLRRYGLAGMVGVAPEDDDGNAAQGNGAEASRPARQPRKAGQSPDEHQAQESGKPAPDLTVTIGFGRSKGIAVGELPGDDLAWYVKAYSENVADAAKSRFRAANQRVLDALLYVQQQRAGTIDPPFAPTLGLDEPRKLNAPTLMPGDPVNVATDPETTPGEEHRLFYLGAITRSANKHKLTTAERHHLAIDFLGGKKGADAEIQKVHALYLVMQDDQIVNDWRLQRQQSA